MTPRGGGGVPDGGMGRAFSISELVGTLKMSWFLAKLTRERVCCNRERNNASRGGRSIRRTKRITKTFTRNRKKEYTRRHHMLLPVYRLLVASCERRLRDVRESEFTICVRRSLTFCASCLSSLACSPTAVFRTSARPFSLLVEVLACVSS